MEPDPEDRLIYLDIDVNDARESFKTAAQFVGANDIKYHFSSKNILELGGRELLSVQDMYALDFDWSTRGAIKLTPQPFCRVIIKLYRESCPLACENFESLCTGICGRAKGSGVSMHYKNVIFHRIIPGFIAQGGDYVMQNGTGGESIWGKKFKDEKNGLKLKHDKAGLVSMCNSGKNSNGSQFFFTFRACPQLDGKHVVFGEVISGYEVLDLIQTVPCSDGIPQQSVRITDCGIWNDSNNPNSVPSQGFWGADDVFVGGAPREELATPVSHEAKASGELQTDVRILIYATKESVLERFMQNLKAVQLSCAGFSSFATIEAAITSQLGFRGSCLLVTAPGIEDREKTALIELCQRGNIQLVVCKATECVEVVRSKLPSS